MKKGKQDPIFSKLQEMLEESSPAVPIRTDPLQTQNETTIQVPPEARV